MSVRPAVWLAATLVVTIDLFTKQWALSALVPGVRHPVLGDALSWQLVFNSGAAFSLGEGYTWVLTGIAVVVTVGIVYYARRARGRLAVALFGVALGGALGNLIDRLFREPGFGRGHVVDMINYNNVFVGNVADIAIVGAAAVFMLVSLFGKRLVEPAPGDPAPAAKATP
ncbi:MAG: signal peptidase II [Demequina sp.]|uniref:signal peptidase II n=1 Tax=Demequina sp. TaxID=2050685 RepID=UPI0019862732|nr:signal peptidase II [Demequina sp.]MBC7298555.1 signal peptidase II [Demequina sp.]